MGEEQVDIEQRSNWPPYWTRERKEDWGEKNEGLIEYSAGRL